VTTIIRRRMAAATANVLPEASEIRDGRLTRAFVISAVAGAAMAGTVMLIRRVNPYIIHYPSEYAQQMGPGTFFYRLGTIGPLALLEPPRAPEEEFLAGRLAVLSELAEREIFRTTKGRQLTDAARANLATEINVLRNRLGIPVEGSDV